MTASLRPYTRDECLKLGVNPAFAGALYPLPTTAADVKALLPGWELAARDILELGLERRESTPELEEAS